MGNTEKRKRNWTKNALQKKKEKRVERTIYREKPLSTTKTTVRNQYYAGRLTNAARPNELKTKNKGKAFLWGFS